MATTGAPSFFGKYISPALNKALDRASTYEAPRTMKVYNRKAGMVYIFCLCVVLTYLFMSLSSVSSIYQQIPADGGLTSLWTDSYAERYYAAQVSEKTTNTYCSSSQLTQFDFCDDYTCEDSGIVDPIWVEKNWQCVYPGLAEASSLTPDSFTAYTALKDVEWQVGDCTTVTSATCTSLGSDYAFFNEGTDACSCRKMTNRFMVGVEDIRVKFRQNLKVSFTPPPYSGSSNVVTASMHQLDTFIVSQDCFEKYGTKAHNHKGSGLCPNEGAHGSQLYYSQKQLSENDAGIWISDVLDIAGISSLNNIVDPFPYEPSTAGENPTYRVMGVGITLRCVYSGHVHPSGRPLGGDSKPRLTIVVENDERNYNSIGNNPVYTSYPNEDGIEDEKTFHNRFYRGVGVKFKFSGTVGVLNWQYMLQIVTNFVVYFGLISVVVGAFVFYALGYESSVYNDAHTEMVTMEQQHAKLASHTLVAAVCYDYITNGDRQGDISRKNMVDVLGKHIDQDDAGNLIDEMLGMVRDRKKALKDTEIEDASDENLKESLTFTEFADLVSESRLDLDFIKEHLRDRRLHGALHSQFSQDASEGPQGVINGHIWEFDLNGHWTPFDKAVASSLEFKFIRTNSGTTLYKGSLGHEFNISMNKYRVNFDTMIQTNTITQYTRKVRRRDHRAAVVDAKI